MVVEIFDLRANFRGYYSYESRPFVSAPPMFARRAGA
jgi:hypothetical protein